MTLALPMWVVVGEPGGDVVEGVGAGAKFAHLGFLGRWALNLVSDLNENSEFFVSPNSRLFMIYLYLICLVLIFQLT